MAIKRLRPLDTDAQKRTERNRRLNASDWTIGNDTPLSKTEQTKWKKYRKALRDMDFSGLFPESPDQERHRMEAEATMARLKKEADKKEKEAAKKAAKPSGKRARKKDGKYQGDDKSTPDVNEAYADGKTPAKKKAKKKS